MPAGEQPAGQHAVFEYGGAVATAIVRLKYAGRSDLIPRFAGVVAGVVADVVGEHAARVDVDVVVPVPLHPRRLVERGFDQAALLAAPLARRLGAPFAPRAIERTRDTPRQASLDRAARADNVAEAFALCSAPSVVAGKRVLLVDDVRTTGATLAACGRVLRQAGADDVLTLVIASRGT
jgi:ComF family protein